MNGAAVATAKDELGDAGDDQNLGLGLDLVESGLEGGQSGAVDDLSCLHDLAGCDIQSRHVPANILIPDDRKNAADRHLEAAGTAGKGKTN